MKRVLSRSSTSQGPAQKAKIDDKNSVDENEDSSFFLRHQNRALAAEIYTLKRISNDFKKQLRTAEKRQRLYDATLSAIHRVWQQLEEDLTTVVSSYNIPMVNNSVFSDDEDDADHEQHQEKFSNELSFMRNLLMKSGRLATVDITDPSVLKMSAEIKIPQEIDMSELFTHEKLFCENISDSSNDEGETKCNRDNKMEPRQVDASLQRRANFVVNLMTSVLSYVNGRSDISLLESNLFSEKREAKAKTACLSDALTLLLQQRSDLTAQLVETKRQLYRTARKYEVIRLGGVVSDSAVGVKQNGDIVKKNQEKDEPAEKVEGKENTIDDDIAIPRDKLESLNFELKTMEELCCTRLVEIEKLRNEKIELESEVTKLRLNMRSPRNSSITSIKIEDGAVTENGESSDSTIELYKLRDALKSANEKYEVEKARSEQAEKLAAEMSNALSVLQETFLRETALMQSKWKVQVEGSNVAMGDAMIGYDNTRSELDVVQLELAKMPDVHFQLESTSKRLKIEEQESRRLREVTKRLNEKINFLETKLQSKESANSSKMSGQYSSSESITLASIEKKLQETNEELAQSKSLIEVLMGEIETTATALDEALTESRLLAEKLQSSEKECFDISSKFGDIRLKCELLTTQKSALEWRCEKAENMKNQAEAIEAAVKSESLLRESKMNEAISERDEIKCKYQKEIDLCKTYEKRIFQLETELSASSTQVNLATERCQELVERESNARTNEQRAKEQASSLQRRLDRAKQNISKLQGQLDVKQGASSGKENAMLIEEVKELRKILRCSVCSSRQKNCILTKCFHMFCRECVDENLRTRHRKCPACSKGFGADDVRPIWLT